MTEVRYESIEEEVLSIINRSDLSESEVWEEITKGVRDAEEMEENQGMDHRDDWLRANRHGIDHAKDVVLGINTWITTDEPGDRAEPDFDRVQMLKEQASEVEGR
jgi:hypothetical protein